MSIIGNMVGCYSPIGKTFVIEDDNGNEYTGVVVDQETIFTATDNDVREGLVYASDSGVSTGTKVIPIYHTREGTKIIAPNNELKITLEQYDLYDYAYLQCIVCQWDTSLPLSLIDIYKVIDSNVYQTGSNVVLQSVTKDSQTKSVSLGIMNTGDVPVVIRYCVYREAE